MEIDKACDTKDKRGWLWGALILGIGLFGVADWLYSSMTDAHRLWSGIGFIFLAPQAFERPIFFTKPLLPQLKIMPRSTPLTNWLSFTGLMFLILSLYIRWV
jgi:hypothetical protein